MPSYEYERKYWEAQTHLIILLRQLGIQYKLDDRIPLFRLRLTLENKLEDQSLIAPVRELVSRCIQGVDYLVEGRLNGYEPYHKGGKYLGATEADE